MNKPYLDLESFKKWMADSPKEEVYSVGKFVEARISKEKLLKKMIVESGDIEKLADVFENTGGNLINTEDKMVLIEVSGGSFYLHRCYLKKD